MDPAIREYLSKNGAKGGHAGKGNELRRKLNKAAAEARWAKVRAARAEQATDAKDAAK